MLFCKAHSNLAGKMVAVGMSAVVVFSGLGFASSGVTYAASAHSYQTATVAGQSVKYVSVDIDAEGIVPVVMTANNNLVSTQRVSAMAEANHCYAAINGTYFQAYSKDTLPYPYGTIIQNGKILHSAGHPVAGLTKDGKLIVDRMTMNIRPTLNGETSGYLYPVWNINHIRTEDSAIVIYTYEYGTTVHLEPGAAAVLVDGDNKVIGHSNTDFTVPSGGWAFVFNRIVADQAERFSQGDTAGYEVSYKTVFTQESDWEKVEYALGAGPTLIINGTVTAVGEDEGFFEDKINKNKSGRSFIGQTADGILKFGNIGSATLREAAAVCQELGCVNAMCLDGGGSVALYYGGSKGDGGREVNNGFGFIDQKIAIYKAIGRSQTLRMEGQSINLQAYNIDGYNYFKLRDIANIMSGTKAKFEVGYDDATNAVTLTSQKTYSKVGGEGIIAGDQILNVKASQSKIYVNGTLLSMTVYNINGNNYFKLRDLGEALNFGVGYDDFTKCIALYPAN